MDLIKLAERFAVDGAVSSVEPLGNGNINATYLVCTSEGCRYVLQRLNTAVFSQPERVMANLEQLSRHCAARLSAVSSQRDPEQGEPAQRPAWQLPTPVPVREEPPAATPSSTLLRHDEGGAWRLLTFVDGAHSVDQLKDPDQALEVGRALGRFHALIHDLPADQLADTLEGFHITPGYYAAYRRLLAAGTATSKATGTATGLAVDQAIAARLNDPSAQWCCRFIAEREDLVDVLEQAKQQGRLQLRPIHGDPKVNNVMLCSSTGCCVAMVDLDTVKPGLVHYDIGDALRSGCNPAGEECTDLEAVRFDLVLARAMLQGYLQEAHSWLTPADLEHLYDAIRLLPFELGLRFFSDHLAGNVYFQVSHPRHNLERALVQFTLAASIEAQESRIRALIAELLAELK